MKADIQIQKRQSFYPRYRLIMFYVNLFIAYNTLYSVYSAEELSSTTPQNTLITMLRILQYVVYFLADVILDGEVTLDG